MGRLENPLPISSAIKIQLVGDDLFVHKPKATGKGYFVRCSKLNSYQVNQIGTLSETLDAVEMAHKNGYTAVISHRSGETEDTTIADIAVAVNAGQIKTGAPSRTDRVAKYNQLFENRRRTLRYRTIRKILITQKGTLLM